MKKINFLLIVLTSCFSIEKANCTACMHELEPGKKISRVVSSYNPMERGWFCDLYIKDIGVYSEEKLWFGGANHKSIVQDSLLDNDEFIVGIFGNGYSPDLGGMVPYSEKFGYITTKKRIQIYNNPHVYSFKLKKRY